MMTNKNVFETILSKYNSKSLNEIRYELYEDIVEECARSVEHIRVWDSNLGDHIRSKMGTL